MQHEMPQIIPQQLYPDISVSLLWPVDKSILVKKSRFFFSGDKSRSPVKTKTLSAATKWTEVNRKFGAGASKIIFRQVCLLVLAFLAVSEAKNHTAKSIAEA
jgi:hypothetical protein